jgi:hypothetical protein
VDNAVDYRVYALPAASNIHVGSDGTVTIPNAIYRCAGTYQVPAAVVDNGYIQSNGITARVASAVDGYTRTLAQATLGYVYTSANAVAGLTPVYVVGAPDISADDEYFFRYQASRDKKYTTSLTEYKTLVATGWRDDGIAFYVPAQASAATTAIVTNANIPDESNGSRYYLAQGSAELAARSSSLNFGTAFNVLKSPASGTKPLMRVFYEVFAARSHDELVAGEAGFTRLRYQGLNNPAATLHYSGITAATTLVVEALDRGCPYQGKVASKSVAGETVVNGSYSTTYQPWYSIADMQKRVANGETYVNGQYDGVTGSPKAIARAYVTVAPSTTATMDWSSTPASFAETFTPGACQNPQKNCFQEYHVQSNSYDVTFYSVDTEHWQLGSVFGELLVNYADWASDTNGKFRMTVSNRKANIASDSFMHATMEVNSLGSARRYPQLIVSDQSAPVQYNFVNGRSLILQSYGDFPERAELEICDHVNWDVNAQCPRFVFRFAFDSSGTATAINPIPEGDKFASTVDGSTKYDLYVSASRAYILVNGNPYACANLTGNSGVSPAPQAPTGPVTITFGDALYHSGADIVFSQNMAGGFINRHQQWDTSRHFDNLGFSSGQSAPAWDETTLPCSSVMTSSNSDPTP